MPASESELAKIQRSYFEQAEIERFHWIGCGEGNNLVRLARGTRCYGVDLFPNKLTFATQQLPEVSFAAADAHHLPFADAAFRSVFARSLRGGNPFSASLFSC